MTIRIKRGWQLTKESFAVLRANPSLWWCAALGGVCAFLAVMAWAALCFVLEPEWPAVLRIGVVAYVLFLLGGFFGVALSACAARALEGEETTVREGLAVARSRLGVIAQWAAIQIAAVVVVTAPLFAGEGLAGALLFFLLFLVVYPALAVASFLVIPILALEDVGPVDGFRRSVKAMRSGWAEAFVGSTCIGVLGLLGWLPTATLIGGYFTTQITAKEKWLDARGAPFAGRPVVEDVPPVSGALAVGLVVILVAAVIIAVIALIQFALTAVFRVALYRYAKTAVESGSSELGGAFQPRPSGYYRPS